MSRRGNASEGGSSSPIKSENVLRWHAEGHIEYYNGSKNATLDSIKMVVLDIRISVTGWYGAGSCKLVSNFIKDLKEELMVREMKKGGKVLTTGTWKAIGKDVKEKLGGNFTTNIIGMNVDTEEIVVLQLSRDNLNAWVEFRATTTETEIYNSILEVTSTGVKKTKGATKWIVPKFTLLKITPKADKKAEELFTVVDAYFSDPSARKANAQDEPKQPAQNNKQEEDHDNLPF